MSSENKSIADLRNAMFDTIDGLRNGTINIDQAKAISDLGQVIINSAKVEVDYLKANNGGESQFLDAIGNDNLPPGITGVHRHRLQG